MNERTLENLYTFVLGREKEIALAELEATLSRLSFVFDIVSVSGNVATINIEKGGDCDVAKIVDILGGTIKIFKTAKSERDSECPNKRMANLEELISDIIIEHRENSTGKLNFGISDYTGRIDRQKINGLGLEVKKELKNRGLHPRFVALRDGDELSSIVTLKNNLVEKGVEIGLFDLWHLGGERGANSSEVRLGILIALNNPEKWSRRDYGKPAGDKYSGMTPPKLARAIVNIALAEASMTASQQVSKSAKNYSEKAVQLSSCPADTLNSVVFDPFCGSGNILMEAIMLGCDVVGSDISNRAVKDSTRNIEWLVAEMTKSKLQMPNKNPNVKICQADATKEELIRNLKFEIRNCNRYAIVTEPYLGEPKKFAPSMRAVMGEYAKVKNIYLGFLKNIVQLFHCSIVNNNRAIEQSSNVMLCVIFPLIETYEDKRYSLYRECVDEIKSLGYIENRPPLIYGREYQIVKREIVFLGIKF